MRVVFGKKETVTVLDESVWHIETLLEILTRFRKKIGRDVRVVLGEDLAYVVSFPLKIDAVYNRTAIKEEAQGLIPENLDEVPWDFQSIAAIIGDKRSNISKGVQVMAIAKIFAHEIAPIIAQAGFVVEVIESESTALARMMHSSLEPVVVVWVDEERSVLVALERGVVVATQSKDGDVTVDQIQTFIEDVNKQFSLVIAAVVFPQEAVTLFENMKKALEKSEYHTRVSAVNPFIGIVKKMDIEGDDADILNVNILPFNKAKNIFGLSLRSRERYLLKIFLVVCLVGGISVIFFVKQKILQKKVPVTVVDSLPSTLSIPSIDQIIPPETVVEKIPAVSEIATPYTVEILNGSGVTGEAAKAGNLLQNTAFIINHIGNADNAKYVTTRIRMKSHVTQLVQDAVMTDLSAVYVCDKVEVLDDTAVNDIMIIVGKRKK